MFTTEAEEIAYYAAEILAMNADAIAAEAAELAAQEVAPMVWVPVAGGYEVELPEPLVAEIAETFERYRALKCSGHQRDAMRISMALRQRVAPEGLTFRDLWPITEWYLTQKYYG